MTNCNKITHVLLTTGRYRVNHISHCGIPRKPYLVIWDTVQTIPRAVGYGANHISHCGIRCHPYLALLGIPCKPYFVLGDSVQSISRAGGYHANHTSLRVDSAHTVLYLALRDNVQTTSPAVRQHANHISRWGITCEPHFTL
jgi:hypothetical protein